jgi:hypothetical protein
MYVHSGVATLCGLMADSLFEEKKALAGFEDKKGLMSCFKKHSMFLEEKGKVESYFQLLSKRVNPSDPILGGIGMERLQVA